MLKVINFKRLFLLIVIFIVLAMVTGLVVGNDDAGFKNNSIVTQSLVAIAGWIFKLLVLPITFIDSVSFFNKYVNTTVFLGIIIFDCVLYSLIIELALVWYKRFKLGGNIEAK
ncbi:hypothetical protein [Mucilaginibacter flavidus]|uniref:hypothetical protein n=1 Tax=Mucilaginibacter flavidus TaxID=2949309 RepID=UPI0020932B6F|nr:hypothetical protein [Mucilaginibacter flavidus]MCO5946260.1 hypothetical protein [Mucilaginibacter flavidus]